MTELGPLSPRPEDLVHYIDNWARHITVQGQLIQNRDIVVADQQTQIQALQVELQRRADLEPEISAREEELDRLRGVIDGLNARVQALTAERDEAIDRLAGALEIKPQKVDGWLIVAIHRAVRMVEDTKAMIRQNL